MTPSPDYLTPQDVWNEDLEKDAVAAYGEYVLSVGGTTWDGKAIPKWIEINARQRNGWRAAVRAAIMSRSDTVRKEMIKADWHLTQGHAE